MDKHVYQVYWSRGVDFLPRPEDRPVEITAYSERQARMFFRRFHPGKHICWLNQKASVPVPARQRKFQGMGRLPRTAVSGGFARTAAS